MNDEGGVRSKDEGGTMKDGGPPSAATESAISAALTARRRGSTPLSQTCFLPWRPLTPTPKSRFSATWWPTVSGSRWQMSLHSSTQALTSPTPEMWRKQRARTWDASWTYQRKPWSMVQPGLPASTTVVTPERRQGGSGLTPQEVTPA